MNKKTITTMLVACALSVSALSTTAVFAEDAVVTGETPAVTETTTTPAPETTPAAFEPEITVNTSKWTGDSDIVFEVDAKGRTYDSDVWVFDDDAETFYQVDVQSKKEVNEEGKDKITFTKDALKNAKMWDEDNDKPSSIAVDWTKYSKIVFYFNFKLDGQIQTEHMFVESSVKAPEITVTPTTPTQPSTPAKPAENKGTTTTTTKKEAPKTGDTMNVALYASLLVVSALAAVVLTTKKKVTE